MSRDTDAKAKYTRVRVGSDQECAKCRKPIVRGDVALRHQRRAETYRERMHADQNGRVAWYRHEGCVESTVAP